ncbi:ribonuclease E activity regulator RraA [Oceanobacillus alkalisoli]|uniref:ribonuclease E activity regulator RraA n=1 Tax=Oceanobacillus alkalisoli TaxID=2925113 RepID=UPI001F11FE91|nr:ribonuclease E activity regulator RraA [Oceanobacillus alkalisoli]MCF3942983.1 ribonuclease E activity regulator RraA [Oceanobacillus alkalisoli]
MDNLKTADICDDHASEVQVCKMDFRSFGKRHRFSGKIETVHVYEDNVLFEEALESVPAGSVIVVNGGGSRNCALMGDRLAGIAVTRGLAGVIINGCVRDSGDLATMDVGILALGTNPLKSKKNGIGERNVRFTFGDVKWRPGSFVYADEDGVIVSEKEII